MKKLTKFICACMVGILFAGLIPYQTFAKGENTVERVTDRKVIVKNGSDEINIQHLPPLVIAALSAVVLWLVKEFLNYSSYATCKAHIDFMWSEWQKGEWYSWAYRELYSYCAWKLGRSEAKI